MSRMFLMFLLSVFVFGPANATEIKPTDLKVLVANADYIVVGKVLKIDMVDSNGHEIKDPKARTGYKSGKIIRYHIVIDQKQVLKGNSKKIPPALILSDWSMWIKELGETKKDGEGKKCIFLLNALNFSPKPPAEFVRDISEKQEIEDILKTQNNEASH